MSWDSARTKHVKRYIGAIDQGTTSTRFMVFDADGRIVGAAQKEHQQIYPKPGWVEHDPAEIISRTLEVAEEAMRTCGISAAELAAVGITNQRETTVIWEKKTGNAIANAIVWQDTRVAEEVARYSADGGQNRFREATGLPLSTYFSSLKARWMLDHVTDVTNASRTQLFNLKTLQWDPALLASFDIPASMLPAVRSSSEIYGEATVSAFEGVPIAGILGDQQAALVGQTCFQPGEVKNTYGTGCFLLMNTGERLVPST